MLKHLQNIKKYMGDYKMRLFCKKDKKKDLLIGTISKRSFKENPEMIKAEYDRQIELLQEQINEDMVAFESAMEKTAQDYIKMYGDFGEDGDYTDYNTSTDDVILTPKGKEKLEKHLQRMKKIVNRDGVFDENNEIKRKLKELREEKEKLFGD